MPQWVLGISYGFHDSAIALLEDGEIAFAAQEERFSRVKQDRQFPIRALAAGLAHCGLTLEALSSIYYYEDPDLKFDRITQTYRRFGLNGLSSFIHDYPDWQMDRRFVADAVAEKLAGTFGGCERLPPVHYVEHHLSHAASAFFPCPFASAAVLCIDGVGEWATTTAWVGSDTTLDPLWEIHFPHSLGLLYSAMTYYCGFKVDSGEYKVMGLAPYGEPIHVQTILDHLIDLKPDGSFWMNMEYFDYAVGDCMISDKFCSLFGGPPRQPESLIGRREFDLAASVQAVLDEAILRLGRTVRAQTALPNLCMAGGVALNCVANGKLQRAQVFDRIWVQPASGDSGGALGAALAGWHMEQGRARLAGPGDRMRGSYLGTAYDDDEIGLALAGHHAQFDRLDEETLLTRTAQLIADGKVVGWFQGAMEYGPRALGARSILGDARNPKMQSTMNLKIKYRESFRPFAPAVLEECARDWFELDCASPYMLLVVLVKPERQRPPQAEDAILTGLDRLNLVRSEIPAVTHVDMSARVQTVSSDSNPRFHRLISRFRELTGCPVVVNTSFNVRGEPIVESPRDAYRCFMRTEMDALVIGSFLLHKEDQAPRDEGLEWMKEFELD